MKTLEGTTMTWQDATQPVGSALRISPALLATTTDEDTGVSTTIEAHYRSGEGKYVITAIANRATRDDFDPQALRRIAPAAILQHAVPHCVAVNLTDDTDGADGAWTTIANLTSADGRIVPPWMAEAATRRGAKEDRYDVLEIIYGAAALAGTPPVKALQHELGIPHRTASDWTTKARNAGRLEGMTYTVGRQADG